MAEITLETLLQIYINIKGYNTSLQKAEISEGEEKEYLLTENRKLIEKIENFVTELKESGQSFSSLSDKILCDFSQDANLLLAANRNFRDAHKVPKNYTAQLSNRVLELIASEDRWIQDIKNTKIKLLVNAMRRHLVTYNDAITDEVSDERSDIIDKFEKYGSIKSHFTSDFFEIFQAVKNDNIVSLLDKTLDDMKDIPKEKVENLFNLSLIQPFLDYYRDILSKLDLSEEQGLIQLFFPLQQISPSAYQRITRYPSLLDGIENDFNKFLKENDQENDEKTDRLKNKITEVLSAAITNTQTLNMKRYNDEKGYAQHSLEYLKEVITSVPWDIRLMTLFGRQEAQTGTTNITSFMRKMLEAINSIEDNVSLAQTRELRKLAQENANQLDESKIEEIKDNVRTRVMLETFKTIVDIAKSTETSKHHTVFSKVLGKDGPNVRSFYKNVQALGGNPFLAKEKLSSFLYAPRNKYDLPQVGIKLS